MLSEHRSHEKNLQSTMTTAQKLSDDIKANAEKKAVRILHTRRFDPTCCSTRRRRGLEDVQREIDGLKLKRKDVEISIEANI